MVAGEAHLCHNPSASLHADIEEISLWDAQYTLMREEVDMTDARDKALYDLRVKRNTFAALVALEWMQVNRPDVVLIPNGLILEMGIVFRVARFLNIPAVTFEFNDQREQIWLAQNTSIMRQDTDYLVRDRCSLPMTDEMYERLADLENARRGARVWGKSKRLWQYVFAQGAEEAHKALGLDTIAGAPAAAGAHTADTSPAGVVKVNRSSDTSPMMPRIGP